MCDGRAVDSYLQARVARSIVGATATAGGQTDGQYVTALVADGATATGEAATDRQFVCLFPNLSARCDGDGGGRHVHSTSAAHVGLASCATATGGAATDTQVAPTPDAVRRDGDDPPRSITVNGPL